jgi:hypothetical protein
LPPIGWANDVVCRHQEAAIEERSDAQHALMRAVLGVDWQGGVDYAAVVRGTR